ncbi:T9SS C-terminal target domain-containing protein [Parabacteroides segnis]|uniref:T9SS C-terminal target domain-containing protein n=1 Tax=Parabacteroides segnis TaxID=2763058 RepID=UPI0035145DD5
MKTIRQQLRAAPRILAGLLFAFMAAMASVVHASPSPPPWNGQLVDVITNADGHDGLTAEKAILIKDAAELAYFAQQVNAGGLKLDVAKGTSINNSDDKDKGFAGLYFALSGDIDLEGYDWTPIGSGYNPFKGHFDGDGYTVKGLKVNIQASNTVYAGLFGHVTNSTFRNLGVWLAPDGIVVSSSNGDVYAGGLVARIYSDGYTTVVIRNCYVEAEGNGAIRITGNNDLRAGGIAGMNSVGLITHCYATVDVEAKSNDSFVQVGGIAGYAQDISYAYATGKVEGRAHSDLYIGGICGGIYASIKNCLALNKEISCTTTGGGNGYKNRIVGLNLGVCFDNYATPGMKLNGQPATGGTTGDYNGADTWSDTFETALKSNPSPDNGWEEAWIWTPGQLPLLKKENADGNGYSQDPVRGQTPRKATDYLVSSPWNGSAATQIESTGDGTFDNPILIGTAAELAYLAQQVNAGGNLNLTNGGTIPNDNGFSGKYFALSADIALEGGNWTPIGNGENPFRGHFDGRGYTVKGLTVYGEMLCAGLFGHVIDGTLCNLGVSLHEDGIKVSYVDGVYAGGIVGMLQGSSGDVSLRNCYVVGNGKVTSTGHDSYVGGIAGAVFPINDNTTSFTHCYATVAVEAEATYTCGVGGIVGRFNGTLSYTYATGSVKANGGERQYAGGICGFKSIGNLTHNLALNSEVAVESGSYCHRIVGSYATDGLPFPSSISSNYARPAMLLNGQPVTSTDASDRNGATTTWSNKLKNDLDPSSNNEWNDAWIWEDGKLPKLKKLVDAGKNTYEGELSGQTPYSVEDYLYSSWADAAADRIENTGNGDGSSPGNPILIKDAAELAYLAQQVNAGGDLTLTNGGTIPNNDGFSGKYFALSADIDLEGGNWTPIGNSISFRGHFDGRGHTVKGLTVNGDMLHAGLFGYVQDGTLCNLGVSLHEDGIKVSSIAGVQAGGIVGVLSGDVSLRNCYVVGNGKVTSTGNVSYVGGIAGAVLPINDNTTSFTHCYATVAVEAEATHTCGAGGIVGMFSGTLSHTYATGSVKANGREDQYAGGICGFKENGNLTHNLALNSEVVAGSGSGSDCHRIVGYDNNPDLGSISSNYARPAMLLNGQPVTSTDTDSFDGSDTWLDTYKADLGGDPASDNSWSSGNWTWTDSNLPQLRRVILDANGDVTGYDEWSSTQTALSASSFLTNKPAPTPPPVEPDPEPTPPTVYYTVTLPAVEGAITDPVAGTYEVESWSTFRFYLTLDADYSESQPFITTSRNETLLPRLSDGAYQVKYVRNDVEVYIDGIVKNNPVANETIEAGYPKVWKSGNNLHMQAVTDEPGYIYTADGKLQTVCRLIAGEIRTIQLPAGIYFVRIGNERFKVVL